jgi:hypothetical protein
MVVSHNREIRSSSTTDSKIAPTSETTANAAASAIIVLRM